MKTIHFHRVMTILIPALGLSLLSHCGSDEKSKNPSPAPAVMGELPADWDARSDWTGSEWEVAKP